MYLFVPVFFFSIRLLQQVIEWWKLDERTSNPDFLQLRRQLSIL